MIVQIRGTSGGGKTWAMRRVMDLMYNWQAVVTTGRKRPWYYYSVSDWPLTVLLGHYDTPCGGCDSIGSARAIYDLTTGLLTGRPVEGIPPVPGAEPVNVLQEGLLLSEDALWTSKLKEEGHDVRCVFLVTPLATCLDNIRRRRDAAGNDKPLNPRNTENRIGVIERARVRLLGAGVRCVRASAPQTPNLILRWLRETA